MLSSDSERNELSRREDEVLRLASNGFTDRQIAATLGIKVSTVTTYWIRIRSKIGQLNRSELVAYAVRQKSEGLIASLRADASDLRKQVARLTEELEIAWHACGVVSSELVVTRPDGSIAFSSDAELDPKTLKTEVIDKESGQWKLSYGANRVEASGRRLL